jgi:hypothetical protein
MGLKGGVDRLLGVAVTLRAEMTRSVSERRDDSMR